MGTVDTCNLRSGQDLRVGRGCPVRRAQGFQAQFSHEFPFWELDVWDTKPMAFRRGLPQEG